MTRTRELTEFPLADRLRIADLGRAASISHNYLTQLFHAATEKTVVAYLREQHMDRGMRLLRHTTIPIKQIVAQIGLNDSHSFNKAAPAATGISPWFLRNRLEHGTNG